MSQPYCNHYPHVFQEHITGLSKKLHNTLGLQIGSVSLLLPSTWNVAASNYARSSLPDQADILIQEGVTPNIYTQHILGCGRQALYMHVDRSYFEGSATGKLVYH